MRNQCVDQLGPKEEPIEVGLKVCEVASLKGGRARSGTE